SPARPGPKKGAPADEPHDHAIGRSRGGLSTKIHLAADGRCRTLACHLTAGQAGDAPAFTEVMAPPACSPTARSSAYQAGHGPGRQALLLPRDPRPPAQTRHPGGDPGTSRPAGQPEAARTGRWQAAGLRPGSRTSSATPSSGASTA